MNKKQDVAIVMLGVCVAVILWVTILNRETQIEPLSVFHPFHSFASIWKDIQRGGIISNFLGNIILFIPVGLLVPQVCSLKRWFLVLTTGTSFSLIIEVVQQVTARGCFDPDDLLLNAIGTMIGWLLWKTLRGVIEEKD